VKLQAFYLYVVKKHSTSDFAFFTNQSIINDDPHFSIFLLWGGLACFLFQICNLSINYKKLIFYRLANIKT
jgi:hypothetical protein